MDNDCRDGGCGAIAAERLRYFTGRHMTARDFGDEQSYHISYRHLHNRTMHGYGVACGLPVRQHPSKQCRKDYVVVGCGLALDCCGREIVVRKEAASPPIPWDDRTESATVLMLCLSYSEAETECVPVLYSEQRCDPQRRENSRVREGYALQWHWVSEADLPRYHWKTRAGGCEPPEEAKGCCLDPQCPPDHCLPIAIVHARPHDSIDDRDIDVFGRPTPAATAPSLTHICHINWPHGGKVSRKELEHDMHSQLRIRFDRHIRAGDGETFGPDGINAGTFEVTYGAGYNEDLDFVDYTATPHLEHGSVAVFPLDAGRRRRHRDERPFGYLVGQIVFVTLKCDFILDRNGVPVDGNHLGGMLPSGDGVRGGTFESWFRVVDDHEKESQS